MILPGGTWDPLVPGLVQGKPKLRVSREFSFGQLTGHAELALAETLPEMETAAQQVTAILGKVLNTLGHRPADEAAIHTRLSIGDRQFLMRLASRHLGLSSPWHSVGCRHCESLFDIEVDEARLPVRQAEKGFPLAKAMTSLGMLTLKAPTGEDVDGEGDSQTALGIQLIFDGPPDIPERLTPEDITRIETCVRKLSPEITRKIHTLCPECGQENIVELDPYACIPKLVEPSTGTSTGKSILSEVDRIARAYHWSEKEILELPKPRRQAYLDMIDRKQGKIS